MFEIKPIHKESIQKSLEKAHRYRLLNEPLHAESICLDVLTIEPENQQAINILLLALTDQFDRRLSARYKQAIALLPQMEDPYRRVYYDGLICERRATALYRRGGPGSGHVAYEWFRRAMDHYEKAEAQSPEGNDDAILRWNTCSRIITRNPDIEAEPEVMRTELLE